jgi:putative peptidoglycan lipid II flippase
MWTPILNNVVGIATLLALLTMHPGKDVLTAGQLSLLGIGTTLGIVVQTVALFPSLRAVGFRVRLTVRLRGTGLGRALRLGTWTLVYVAANQVAFLVVTRLATDLRPGFSVYINAFLIVSLPHAIVAVSVISALLPQMSRHAAAGDDTEVARDLARGTRLAAVALVPAALLLIALQQPIAHLLFGYGKSAADAGAIGNALVYFALGLVPFSAFQVQLRAFYALADTRTPALINIAVNAANIAADLVLFAVLPANERLYGLAAGYSLSYVVAWVVTTRVLSARLGRLGTSRTVRLLTRLVVAGGLGAALALGIADACARVLGKGFAGSAAAVVVGAAAAGAVVVVVARRLRVAEIEELVAVVLRRPAR